ncbi:MAG TPA: AraC family transcriptional regulator, partial [Motiliproteus sp.]
NCFLVADLPAGLAPALEQLPAFVDLDPALAHYVAFLYQQFGQASVSVATQRQMLLLLIDLLLERFNPRQSLDRRVALARQYLDDHFQQPVTMVQLATAAHLSPRQLGALFSLQLGMTPQQYLIEKRMRHAWQLLTDSPLPVQQVAERVGYSSLSAFSRRFSEHFGRSPRHFR